MEFWEGWVYGEIAHELLSWVFQGVVSELEAVDGVLKGKCIWGDGKESAMEGRMSGNSFFGRLGDGLVVGRSSGVDVFVDSNDAASKSGIKGPVVFGGGRNLSFGISRTVATASLWEVRVWLWVGEEMECGEVLMRLGSWGSLVRGSESCRLIVGESELEVRLEAGKWQSVIVERDGGKIGVFVNGEGKVGEGGEMGELGELEICGSVLASGVEVGCIFVEGGGFEVCHCWPLCGTVEDLVGGGVVDGGEEAEWKEVDWREIPSAMMACGAVHSCVGAEGEGGLVASGTASFERVPHLVLWDPRRVAEAWKEGSIGSGISGALTCARPLRAAGGIDVQVQVISLPPGTSLSFVVVGGGSIGTGCRAARGAPVPSDAKEPLVVVASDGRPAVYPRGRHVGEAAALGMPEGCIVAELAQVRVDRAVYDLRIWVRCVGDSTPTCVASARAQGPEPAVLRFRCADGHARLAMGDIFGRGVETPVLETLVDWRGVLNLGVESVVSTSLVGGVDRTGAKAVTDIPLHVLDPLAPQNSKPTSAQIPIEQPDPEFPTKPWLCPDGKRYATERNALRHMDQIAKKSPTASQTTTDDETSENQLLRKLREAGEASEGHPAATPVREPLVVHAWTVRGLGSAITSLPHLHTSTDPTTTYADDIAIWRHVVSSPLAKLPSDDRLLSFLFHKPPLLRQKLSQLDSLARTTKRFHTLSDLPNLEPVLHDYAKALVQATKSIHNPKTPASTTQLHLESLQAIYDHLTTKISEVSHILETANAHTPAGIVYYTNHGSIFFPNPP